MHPNLDPRMLHTVESIKDINVFTNPSGRRDDLESPRCTGNEPDRSSIIQYDGWTHGRLWNLSRLDKVGWRWFVFPGCGEVVHFVVEDDSSSIPDTFQNQN